MRTILKKSENVRISDSLFSRFSSDFDLAVRSRIWHFHPDVRNRDVYGTLCENVEAGERRDAGRLRDYVSIAVEDSGGWGLGYVTVFEWRVKKQQ